MKLLSPNESHPFNLYRTNGKSSLVLICEHAGKLFPEKLGQLGLSKTEVTRHFAWDIGALKLSKALSDRLDAPLLHQSYSRLVCDCNRHPDVPSFIPEKGEDIMIPGNHNMAFEERQARTEEIWKCFHSRVSAFLDARDRVEQPTIVISIHSFTPLFLGDKRDVKIGILCDKERRLSNVLHASFEKEMGTKAQINAPYSMSRKSDYTIPVHGEDRGYHCSEIEVRNDLIRTKEEVDHWAERISKVISDNIKQVGV